MEQKIDYYTSSSKTSFKTESNSEAHRNRSYCSSGINFEIAEMGIPLKMDLRNENEFKDQSFQVHQVEMDDSAKNGNNNEHHLLLSEWLVKERNTSSSNIILLDPEPPEPDPQLAGLSSSQGNLDTGTTGTDAATVTVVSLENPIKCKLCHLQLTSEIQVKNHVRMCWHSNKSKHRFCVICQMYFSLAEDLNRHNKKHSLENDNNILLEDEDDVDDVSNSESVPLKEWIQNQRKYSHKVIILEPDPTTDDNYYDDKFETAASIIKDANNPVITCKLCGLKLVSDTAVKKHVQNCWEFYKNQHIYCVPCEITFAFHFGLQHHNKIQHFVSAENIDAELKLKDIAAEKQEKEFKSDHELCPSPLGELGKWITKQRKDTLNVILLEPDPTSANYTIQTVCETCSLTCKLCGFDLKSESEVKKHVLMCYQFNKTHHRFCVPCNTPFTYTKSLQRHNKNKHFAGFKERVSSFPTPTEKVYEGVDAVVCSLNSKDEDEGTIHNNNSNSEIIGGFTNTFQLGEIGEWIKNERKKDPFNVILLEPDPAAGINPNPDTDTEVATIISKTCSLTCKLCEIKLITETQIKRHVKRCWLFNKSQHRYCVQCKVTYAYTKGLQRHNKRKHS